MIGTIVAYAAALLAQGDSAGPTAREPASPDRFVQSVEIRCGSQILIARGYGAHLGAGARVPVLLLNGRTLRGTDADRIRADLSRPGAAYRMMAQCHPRGTILFAFNIGERVFPDRRPPGEMRFHRGSAEIGRGRIAHYRGLQPISEEQYWFR